MLCFPLGQCGLAAPHEALRAAGIPSARLRGGTEQEGGNTSVLDFSTLGSLLVLTVCELDILCNNVGLNCALFMRAAFFLSAGPLCQFGRGIN